MEDDFYASKLDQIKELLKRVFNSKGYKQNHYFDKTVWFMTNDQVFHNEVKKNKNVSNETPDTAGGDNEMVALIKRLDESHDLFNLKVSVEKFINQYSIELVNYQRDLDRSERQIEAYNSHKNTSLIEAKIKIFEQKNKLCTLSMSELAKMELSKEDFYGLLNSSCEVYLNRFKNLSVGEYDVKGYIRLIDIDSEDFDQELKKDRFKITELNQYFKHDETNRFDIKFTVPVNESMIKKDYDSLYSGCGLVFMKLEIFKGGNRYSSLKKLDFFHLFLNNLDNILDCVLKFNVFSINYPLKDESNPEISVDLDLVFHVGDSTYIMILKRLYSIFHNSIRTSSNCRNVISFLTDNYFQESVTTPLKAILDKKEDKKGCDGCASCKIF